MTISSAQHTITTTPTIIVPADNAAEEVHLHAVGALYVGGENLTTANGYLLDNKDKVVVNNDGNAIYAVVSVGTAILYVLVNQK